MAGYRGITTRQCWCEWQSCGRRSSPHWRLSLLRERARAKFSGLKAGLVLGRQSFEVPNRRIRIPNRSRRGTSHRGAARKSTSSDRRGRQTTLSPAQALMLASRSLARQVPDNETVVESEPDEAITFQKPWSGCPAQSGRSPAVMAMRKTGLRGCRFRLERQCRQYQQQSRRGRRESLESEGLVTIEHGEHLFAPVLASGALPFLQDRALGAVMPNPRQSRHRRRRRLASLFVQ